jgi:ABC-2 type transport system ATP-binding protein
MSFVQVRGLGKQYAPDGPKAVDDLSFDIREGEIFSLLGPNGAGKTTTISILSTLLPATSGEAFVSGHSVQREPMAVRRLIGIVPQDLALYSDLSARENLRFWGEMRGLSGEQLKREIDEKLALTDLTERAKDRVSTFSGGMKRRLNLAIGLLGNPPLVILDEPTVAIDPQSRRYILDWVKEMNAKGTTVLYTTHYMEEAQELSHRIGIMDHGKLIVLGTLAELVQMVGEHETLILRLQGEETGEALAAAMGEAGGVSKASSTNGEVVLNVESAEEVLPVALRRATDLGLTIRTVEIREPNLETVFLHLTGRALRD